MIENLIPQKFYIILNVHKSKFYTNKKMQKIAYKLIYTLYMYK